MTIVLRIRWLFMLWTIIIFLLSPSESYAGIEFEEWHTLPQIEDIVFSETSVGFVSQDRRYFVMDRKSRVFQQVDEKLFLEKFSDSLRLKPHEKIKGGDVIRASNGSEFQSEEAYCSEGANQHHKLWLDGKLLQDIIDPCASISAVEIIDNQLWIGTLYITEGGENPANGIIIQSLQEPKLIKKITTNEGLNSNLIRAIRIDSQGDKVWVATERGINEVNLKFQVILSYYFYEDFDKLSHKPTVFLSPSPKSNNPFAIISRMLSIQDSNAFYEAVKSIPSSLHNKVNLYYFFMGGHIPDFLPSEMNVLVPFFIEAAQSNQKKVRWFALSNLCKFNDKRIYNFIKKSNPANYAESLQVRDCLAAYTERGLIKNEEVSPQVEILIERMQNCLNGLRRSVSDSSPSCYSDSIVGDAKLLKRMGSNRGMLMINEFFQTSQWNFIYSEFYDSVFSKLYNEDELIAGALEGMKKIKNNPIYRGCAFFDMRYNKSEKRYGAKYVEAILLVIERAMYPHSEEQPDPYNSFNILITQGFGSNVKKECTEALESQMTNDKVKEEFMKGIYPTLSDNQKRLADKFIKRRD